MERNSYLIVAKAILADKRVCTTARLLLAQLLDHRNKRTGQCNPREMTLAEEIGVSRYTIIRALEALKKVGLIEVKRTQRGNRYEFPMLQNATSHVANSNFPMLQNGTLQAPYPLYEPYIREPSGFAASPPKKQSLNTPAPLPRKSAQSEVLEAYYREERRKAAKA